jgi:uncharacterized protein involved in outer membrane biogenesis
MKNVWRWSLGFIGVVAAAIVLVVIFFNWNWLKGPIQSQLSALTGKQVHIDGSITGTKAWIPHIVLNQIRIDEPDFAAAPTVATIDSIAVDIDLKRLLRGTLDFPSIEISHPVLDLLRSADGKSNWDIAAEAKGPNDRGSMPLIGILKVENGKVHFRDAAKQTTIDATIATIGARGGEGQGEFTLDGHGTYREAPFTLKLKGGSLDELRNEKKPYQVEATATVGKTSITIAGTITDPFKLTDMNLKATAQGDNAEELYPIFGIPAPTTPPYKLSGILDRDGKDWLFKNFAGTVGKSDLAGNLRFKSEGQRLFVGGDLKSKTLDFADLGLLVGGSGSTAPGRPVSEGQKKLAAREEASERVLPDAPLNLKEVRNVDADITLRGEHILAQSLPLEDVDMHLTIDNGVLSFTPLRVGVAGGRIIANIVINARDPAVLTDYDVQLSRFKLEDFLQSAGFSQGGQGFINGRIRLHGVGDSVRKSLASASGQASAVVSKGTISNLAADILGLDVAKAVGLLITGDKQIALRCLVADFTVDNGLMKPRTLVLDTDATLVTGGGTVNLADEHVDLNLNGQPKSATPLALGGPIEIGGTFKKLDVGLGPKAIAKGGAALALGAILTPLAAIVGFIDVGGGEDIDCAPLEQAAAVNGDKPPPHTTSPQRKSAAQSPHR